MFDKRNADEFILTPSPLNQYYEAPIRSTRGKSILAPIIENVMKSCWKRPYNKQILNILTYWDKQSEACIPHHYSCQFRRWLAAKLVLL